jgi:hypothetical protein
MLTSKILSILKQYLPKFLPYLAFLLVGVGVGWKMKPTQVERVETVKVQVVEKEVVVIQEKVRVEIVKVKDSQTIERIHKEEKTVTSPDGTVVATKTEDHNIDSIIHEKENSTEVKVVEVEKQVVVVKTETKEVKITPVLAQWHIGILGGVDPSLVPFKTNGYLVGGEVERRIVGPIWGGIWGMGSTEGRGMGGIKVSLEF